MRHLLLLAAWLQSANVDARPYPTITWLIWPKVIRAPHLQVDRESRAGAGARTIHSWPCRITTKGFTYRLNSDLIFRTGSSQLGTRRVETTAIKSLLPTFAFLVEQPTSQRLRSQRATWDAIKRNNVTIVSTTVIGLPKSSSLIRFQLISARQMTRSLFVCRHWTKEVEEAPLMSLSDCFNCSLPMEDKYTYLSCLPSAFLLLFCSPLTKQGAFRIHRRRTFNWN